MHTSCFRSIPRTQAGPIAYGLPTTYPTSPQLMEGNPGPRGDYYGTCRSRQWVVYARGLDWVATTYPKAGDPDTAAY
jgi:hypothetical protein